MQEITDGLVTAHPLDAEDAAVVAATRTAARSGKGISLGIEARDQFDTLMENVLPRSDVTFEADKIGGVPGVWVYPNDYRPDQAILHLHAGWFSFGSAKAFRHLVGHIAARANAKAFIPNYRLAPENPFPHAPRDVAACYRGLAAGGIQRIAITGDSAGGNLALGLAARAFTSDAWMWATLVGVAVQSPVTDLTLSGATYATRAEADPFFTRTQVAQLVHTYLRGADPTHPLASPLYGPFEGLPPYSHSRWR